jgi:WD40 repeat protein/mono/diheme cytochrome c family protein
MPADTLPSPLEIEEQPPMAMRTTRVPLAGVLVVLALAVPAARADATKSEPAPAAAPAVSYDKQIRPIFQARCQGCHQPAKPSGGYVMTAFDRLLSGGKSKVAAVVPSKPDESFLVDQIIPDGGKAEMPRNEKPLTEAEIELVKQWIAQGAVDDTPQNTRARYDMEHPPVYTRPPVITALDFAPDGSVLAVAGFHEILLMSGDGEQRTARLVGLAERIESVRFSPDGTRLAVTGGRPGRMGEVQVWDVAKRKLLLSVPVTFDTIYGASWSPDGTKIAFGCADNSVRAIDAKTGEQVLFQGSHNDWVLDTVFSTDGSHLVSVGRDRTAKLTEVETQRFIDNITSITPGALKGGILAVARHPKRDEVVVGGSDGTPKIYRIFRQSKRVIGDDANLIRQFPLMPGRVNTVAVSPDGKRIAAGSSADGTGEVAILNYDFDTSLPENIKAIESKVVSSRSEEEKKTLEEYRAANVKVIAQAKLAQGGIYAVTFRPDGKLVAAAGSDGNVRLIDAENGEVVKQFAPAPIGGETSEPAASPTAVARESATAAPLSGETETLPKGSTLAALAIEPSTLRLTGRFDVAQVVVTGTLDSGERIDVTRMVDTRLSADIAEVSRSGQVRAVADGEATLSVALAGRTATLAVTVTGVNGAAPVSFVHDVAPVLSRLGCNQGTCHGSAQGKNGFKLSLRGYDPLFDVRALTDELGSRRVNVAAPDSSLMLLKPTGAVPHVGGQLFVPGEPYYQIIRDWIADGAKLDLATHRVTAIAITPENPSILRIGGKQQMRVMATYADGSSRDVTREAFIESGNGEVATAARPGLITSLRRGEAPILARFEGAYAATTLTVMGDRGGFVWSQPPSYGTVDDLVAAKWQRLKILPSELCSDADFIRRASIDLTGLPPSEEDVQTFLADESDNRTKRAALVERLIGSKPYVEYWTNKWADLLEVNRKFLGVEGASAYRKWIRAQVENNTPYDDFVRAILTAQGSNRENPPASYFKILRDPAETMENTTHLFMAVRFNCNKCHDHPFERWTQDQYYQTAAFFAQVGLKADPESKGAQIGQTAVEKGKPLYEVISDLTTGEVKHERTGQLTAPKFPFTCRFESDDKATRRERLAAWISSKDNPYFARSYVNRLWGYLFGVGIMEPIDDIRAGNPPTNPELLDYLTAEFKKSGFDVRHVVKLICTSRTYQLAVATNKWNEDDKTNYSHAVARRLPAEVLYDSVYRVLGAVSKFPGVAPGTRAAELPDSGVELPSGFLTTFGRPARESACECERTSGLQLGPVMALVSGPTIGEAIDDPKNEVAKLVAGEPDDQALVNRLFLRILNRPATEAEIAACARTMTVIDRDHAQLVADLEKREAEVAPIHARQEKEREEAMAVAKTELEAYEKEIGPRLAAEQKAHEELIVQRIKELKEYEGALPTHLAAWEKAPEASVEWVPLGLKVLGGSSGTTLTRLPDRSIIASGKAGVGTYTLAAETELKGITAIRLEVLTDDALPKKGPGRAKDGNFVLNEFEVRAAARGKPGAPTKVALQNARADFSQANFDVAAAIDGNDNSPNMGWAVSPQGGITHWAVFEPKQALGSDGGTVLTFVMTQIFRQGDYGLGRFRISVTTAKAPVVGLSYPEEVAAILGTQAKERSEADKKALLAFFGKAAPELRKRTAALAEAQKPLPVDPKLKELRDKLAEVSQPVPVDPRLAQLRGDVAMSVKQLGDKRLTAAQDIAWALINSPAFLFNH